MRSLRSLTSLLGGVLACTGTSIESPVPVPDEPMMCPSSGPASRFGHGRTHLVLERRERGGTIMRRLAFEGDGATFRALAPFEQASAFTPAVRFSYDVERPLGSHDGGDHWVTAFAGHGAWWELTRFDLSGNPAGTVSLAMRPDALHLVGELAFVGAGNEVGVVDFSQPSVAYRRLVRRPEMQWKAYDLIVSRGDWVIAIDDMVMPIYADTFRLRSEVEHAKAWTMPTFINGQYTHATLHRRGDADGTLYLLGAFHHRGGRGHALVALEIEAGELELGGDVVLNRRSPSEERAVVEERWEMPQSGDGPNRRLVAGDRVSPWLGLSLLEDGDELRAVVVAAGERGLLVFPPRVHGRTQPDVVPVGGEARDVLAGHDRVFVLVGGKRPALAAYTLVAGRLVLCWRYDLPETYQRFLR